MTIVSVIIPTNRPPAIVEPCLAALARQDVAPNTFEVLLVCNGAAEPHDWRASHWPFRMIVENVTEANIAAAKNVALERAAGSWVVFLNDDVLPAPDFIRQHLAAHQGLDQPALVLGESAWQRYPDETVFDRMIQNTSMVFFYDQMSPHTWYGFRHAWNLNLSLRREYLVTRRFNAALGPFFFEDLELAWRLEQECGLRVWYAPEAHAIHDHRYTLGGYLERERALGAAALRLSRHAPECYRAVYGGALDDEFLEFCERFVATDGRRADEQERWLRDLVVRPADNVFPTAEIEQELVRALYLAHLPLKRVAFRRGLLDAVALRSAETRNPAVTQSI